MSWFIKKKIKLACKKIMIFGGLTEWPKISGSKQTGSLESSDEDESGNENY